ncbi:MAG TPA: PepSY domain-containing protein, partial [Gammaproteobacteria bacterium]|nr:PepSY domain-containing protein [Gammaproteobacteria bacterium]
SHANPNRKPEGVVGAPIPLPNARMGNTVTVITILLAVFLPLLAISLVTILLLEWLVLRRFEISRRWLGLQNS